MARDDLTGVLLVGGASSRFGSPKALARLGGETLAERTWRVLGEACAHRLAVGKGDEELPFPVVPDGVTERATIHGLAAAVRAVPTDLCVVLPVDAPLVTAEALLELAAGTAGEESDVDVYVVSEEARYLELCDRREAFMRAWGEPVSLEDVVDFEGLGFDMVRFWLADGVRGEVAFGHTGNLMTLHGGPHEVLVDRVGLLDGVEFPLL